MIIEILVLVLVMVPAPILARVLTRVPVQARAQNLRTHESALQGSIIRLMCSEVIYKSPQSTQIRILSHLFRFLVSLGFPQSVTYPLEKRNEAKVN